MGAERIVDVDKKSISTAVESCRVGLRVLGVWFLQEDSFQNNKSKLQ